MSQYVLGIHPATRTFGSHDPCAVIFSDGDFVFGIEEERLTRVKHAENTFPNRAIQQCLDYCDITLSDVNRIAVPWKSNLYRKSLVRNLRRASSANGPLRTRIYETVQEARRSIVSAFFSVDWVHGQLEEIGEPVPPIEEYSHHRAHAVSALYPADFDDGIVLTLDGRGEYDSTVVWRADGSSLDRVRTYEYPNSLGLFFGAITKFLGYYPLNGEGKVMGLAPYGGENEQIEAKLRQVFVTGVDYDTTEFTRGGFEGGVQRLEELFGRSRNETRGQFDQWEKDLAFVAQKLLEEAVVDITERYCLEFETSNVALAGGVALNCKMNRRIMELDVVDDLFIQPVANDAGTAIGAAALASHNGTEFEMPGAYWGPEYTTEDVVDLLEKNKIDYSIPDDLEQVIASEIASGKLVGWYQGRLEIGPRALGNRSILADPRTSDSRDRVNEYVKHREGWRPFAPSMLEEAVEEYLEHPEPSPFMIKTFKVESGRRDDIEAVLHPADDTTRPQTVNEDQNPRYHRLIKAFEEETGVPVVLNTSFNDHAEPIVNTPREAIKDFYGMGLDVLALGDVVVRK